jgi:hypothetical protein
VVKRQSPIESRRQNSWETEISSLVSILLSIDPITISIFHKLPLLASFAFSRIRDQIVSEIQKLIDERITVLSPKLLSQTSLENCAIAARQLLTNVELFDGIFAVFQARLTEYIWNQFHHSLKPRVHIPAVNKFVLDNIVDAEEKDGALAILQLLDRTRLLSLPEYLPLIGAAIVAHIRTVGLVPGYRGKIQLKPAFTEYAKIIVQLPPALQNAVADGFATKLANVDPDAFGKEICPILFSDPDSLAACILCSSNANFVVSRFVTYVEGTLEQKFDPASVIRVHQGVLKWPPVHRGILEQSLRRLVGQSTEVFLTGFFKQLADRYNSEGGEAIPIVESIALVEDHSAVESLYGDQLLRRSVEDDLELDRIFMTRYTQIVSPDKTIYLRSILKDHDEGLQAVAKFSLPQFLKINVTCGAFWKPAEIPLAMPDPVNGVLSSFAEFYATCFPRRRLSWDATLSSAILQYKRGSLQCDGVTAILLLTLSRRGAAHTMQGLADELGLKPSTVEAIVKALKSSRCGQLLTVSGSKISAAENLSLGAVFIVPRASERTQPLTRTKSAMPAFMSETSQIDTVVLRVLKERSSLTFPQLLAAASSLLKFTVTEEEVTARLKELEARHFVALDPSGGWRFLP